MVTPAAATGTRATVSAKVKYLMHLHGHMTQTDLARAIGLSQSAVSDKLNEHYPWTTDDLDALAAYFGVPAADLVTKLPRLDSNQQPAGYRLHAA